MERLTVRRLFLGAILVALLIPAIGPVSDPDYFWHVRVGRYILEHGAIPRFDLFTFTVADHAFVAHEWLSEVLIALLTSAGGLAAVSIYFGIVTWLGFLGLLASMRRVGYVIAGLGLFVGVAAANPIFGPRTQMETFALVIGLLLLTRRYEDTGDRRWLYPLPLAFVLWVNLHAGFTIGLIFLATATLGRFMDTRLAGARSRPGGPPVRPLALALAASTLAVLVNPNTYRIYLYAAQTQFSPAQQKLIVEWFSPDFHDLHLLPFELMLLLLGALLALSSRRPTVSDGLLLAGGTVLALHSVRHIALFVAVATPIMAELAQGTWERWKDLAPRIREPRPGPVIGAINGLVLALVMVVTLLVTGRAAASGLRSRHITADYPVAAVDFIDRDLPPGHMFNQYGWGGYLVFRLWPRTQVYVYGDAAVMGDSFLTEWNSVELIRPDFRRTLSRRGVTWVIDRPNTPLVVALDQTPEWVRVYTDSRATVMLHRTPQTQDWLARHGRS
ncbi:MAG: hypothetical protein ABR573_00350 [Candidatus Dormibacteria bacterium]